MFSKRPDKHTTGFINMRNDCFANSSVQAYSSLPGLAEYINAFYVTYKKMSEFMKTRNIDAAKLPRIKSNTKFKNSTGFEIPLHIALGKVLKKLQDTQLTSRTISVWTFLHCLEKIFSAKISRSQHDAQELTQLINETLEFENTKLKSFLKQLKLNLATLNGLNNVPSPQDYEVLEQIEVPEFPFSGLILTQMRCLACNGVSKPSFSPFLMLTLHAPEKSATDIETLLEENESESIEGYQCVKCRINAIVAQEKLTPTEDSKPEYEYISTIKSIAENPAFCINDDLSPELEKFIKDYKKNDTDVSQITSTVLRKNQILKPPKIVGLHLSRSSFNGVDISRNPCRVSFKDHLVLSIGKEYHEELQQFQAAAAAEAEAIADASENGSSDDNLATNVLTRDVNDMEEESLQREDVDEKGPEDDDDEDAISTTDDSSTVTESEAGLTTESEDESESESEDDVVSTAQQSINTSVTLEDNNKVNDSVKAPETLNNAPITEDQTDHLKEHFKSFKFNDNDVYKYRLKAMIRHQGSHTQGHYECYKHKPLFVKDKDGIIFKLSPEIIDDINEETTYGVEPATKAETEAAKKEIEAQSEPAAPSRRRGFSLSHSGSIKRSERDPMRSRAPSSANPPSSTDLGGDDSGFRHKFSSMMGRRPSIIQGRTQEDDIQEILNSGLQTPAEVLVGEIQEPSDYFSTTLSTLTEEKKPEKKPKKVKMKKIPSLIKNPYWRISDAAVSEVSKSSVLCETTSVYMLYYERVDRKQVKSQ